MTSFWLHASPGTSINEVAKKIQSDTGRKTETLPADLSVAADVQRVAARLASDSAITAFVNNAGIASASKLLESDPDYLDQIIQINVTAFSGLAVAAASAFAKHSKGLIINIGSVVAQAPGC